MASNQCLITESGGTKEVTSGKYST